VGYYIYGGMFAAQSENVRFNNLGTNTGTVTVSPSGINNVAATEYHDSLYSIDMQKAEKIAELYQNKMSSKDTYENSLLSNAENQAVLTYAEKNDMLVSDKEVNAYINELINAYETSDDYATIKFGCAMAGTSFEEVARSEFLGYRIILTREKMYESFLNDYLIVNNLDYADMNEDLQKMIHDEWFEFIETLSESHEAEVM